MQVEYTFRLIQACDMGHDATVTTIDVGPNGIFIEDVCGRSTSEQWLEVTSWFPWLQELKVYMLARKIIKRMLKDGYKELK